MSHLSGVGHWANDEVTSLLWLSDGTLGAATGRGQLFSSTDGGDTWAGGVFLPGGSVLDLAMAGSSRLLAAGWTGLYASDDGGQTWSNLASALGTPNAYALLAATSGVLLGTQTGLYQWQADTHSWQRLVDNIPVTSLADAAAGHPLYFGTIGDGVYRSDDAGTSWHKLPGLGVGVPEISVNPQNSNHLVLLAAWAEHDEPVPESRTQDKIQILGEDVIIHLGDSDERPPWWPLFGGRKPSLTWTGGFYLNDPGTADWALVLELMQLNEIGTTVAINGVTLSPDLPQQDFTRR